MTEKQKAWFAANAEKVKGYKRKWYIANKERLSRKASHYYSSNCEKLKSKAREHYAQNREAAIQRAIRYSSKRSREDGNYRMRKCLRTAVYRTVKRENGMQQRGFTERLIGCSLAQFENHIESLFKDGMSWENYGEWHIDHIIPCAAFNLLLEEHQKACFHFSNLQPEWGIDNMMKCDKLPSGVSMRTVKRMLRFIDNDSDLKVGNERKEELAMQYANALAGCECPV